MVTAAQIAQTLSDAGIRAGATLLVHCSLRSIGTLEGGPDALIDVMLDLLGPAGTLSMPTFNYSQPRVEPYFDPRSTPGRTGALTELFRRRPGTIRSLHPTHSVAGFGARAEEFLVDHYKADTFGAGSPLDRMARAGGFVLLLGVTHLANSTIHVGETHARRVKFFWDEGLAPTSLMLLPDGRVINHTLDATPACSLAFNEIDGTLRDDNQITDLYLGAAPSFLMRGQDVIDAVVRLIRRRDTALLCNRPSCRPCSMARKHLGVQRG